MKIVAAAVFLFALSLCGSSYASDYAERKETKAFITELAREQGIDRVWLEALFRNAERQERALELIQKPYEKKPWSVYQSFFLTNERKTKGLEYWRLHAKLLQQITSSFNIPSSIIVAIVGIETNYGRNMGYFPVFDTLVTLAFDFPRRSKFFSGELKALLTLANNGELDVNKLKGSYAGAFGIGQFIPSSFNAYAIDFDGDKKRDITANEPDALASVANYLQMNGWKNESLIALPLKTQPQPKLAPLINNSKKPWLSEDNLTKIGIIVNDNRIKKNKFSLLAFDLTDDKQEYWLAFHNFYVIKTYNPSALYALAVYRLGQSLDKLKASSYQEKNYNG